MPLLLLRRGLLLVGSWMFLFNYNSFMFFPFRVPLEVGFIVRVFLGLLSNLHRLLAVDLLFSRLILLWMHLSNKYLQYTLYSMLPCTVFSFCSFGNSHFCAGCHADFQRLVATPAHLLPQCPVAPRAQRMDPAGGCPLRVQHPPTGQEFSLGCGVCRNLTTF